MAFPSVLLVGASGSAGVPLVAEFQKQRSKFSRVGILADPSRLEKFQHLNNESSGIEIIAGSFLDPSAYSGFNTLILLTGNAVMYLQPAMIEAAIQGGVKHIYPSEYGADLSIPDLFPVRYFRDKYLTRKALEEKTKEHTDVKYTLFMNGGFTEAASILVGLEEGKVTLYGKPDTNISLTAIPDIVRYIVASINLPFQSNQQKREIRVAGEILTREKLISILGEIQGVKYDTQYVPVEELREKEKEAREKGDVEQEMLWSLKGVFANGLGIVEWEGGKLDNGLFGWEPVNVRKTLERTLGKK
ncbi:hypothetical protein B7494_g5677 [Chlorociboria aeruginascens]|nr:hypothetical protein B7494_g5677 [Chlorociboria aeruginascens]